MSGGLILTLLIFLPVAAAAIVWALPKERPILAQALSLGTLGVNLALCIVLWTQFDATSTDLQFVTRVVWIQDFGVEYFVGVDQLSFWMVVLTGVISLIAGISSLSIKKHTRGYWAMFLLLNAGMFGVFVSLDFFLFYIFWEIMLLPMYFLIGIWGGPRKEYAAIKFFLYTLTGSVLMLLCMIALYYGSDARALAGTGLQLAGQAAVRLNDAGTPMFVLANGTLAEHTFNIPFMHALASAGHWASQASILGFGFTKIIWVGLFIGFAIKLPMFPLHTWLPDAHVEAPTPVSAILAGILLKMGTYGILRFNFQILPEATRWAAGAMAVFGMINIVYAAFVCLAQRDLKKIIAYSSVSHMGFCLLGFAAMTPQGLSGAYFTMIAHGVVSPMLFLLVGVIYDRSHTRDVEAFGGLASQMPEYAALTGLAFFASLGLPGLAGFVGEVLVFLGAFSAYRGLVMVSVLSVIITAGYYLWTMQRVFLGKFNEAWAGHLPPLSWRERITLYPLGLSAIILGLFPMFVFSHMNRGLYALLENTAEAARRVAGL
ncbi:MAG: NADH-quinone oxidoreductase subunit M [Deltaproteobacteria bacterium]|nr:NADH-quinone oxidoreductase subunit M [Deltaproteobacteria bacterium]